MILFPLDKYPEVELLRWCGSFIFNLLRNPTLFPTVAVPSCNPTNSTQDGACCPRPHQCLFSLAFLMTAILAGVRWPLRGGLICMSLRIRGVGTFSHLKASDLPLGPQEPLTAEKNLMPEPRLQFLCFCCV